MKSLLWIANCLLALILVILCALFFFSRQAVPQQPSLRIEHSFLEKEKERKPFDAAFLKTIYEDNDLFGTFVAKAPEEARGILVTPPPQPPTKKPVAPLEKPEVRFLEPLNITITGIIMSTNESENRVILQDNGSKQEKIYKTHEKIEDAHILRIFNNKVIFIRSNGQLETLFISPTEARDEMSGLKESSWSNVVRKESETTYLIDPQTFVARVKGLPEFLQMLDLTTVFSKSKSVGCRVGKIDEKSLGAALGLQARDVILKINGIPVTTTSNRVEIYNTLRSKENGATVKVDILRNKTKMSFEYILQSLKKESLAQVSTPSLEPSAELTQEEKIKIMKEKYKFNPTINEFNKRDRNAMIEHGSRNSVLAVPH